MVPDQGPSVWMGEDDAGVLTRRWNNPEDTGLWDFLLSDSEREFGHA